MKILGYDGKITVGIVGEKELLDRGFKLTGNMIDRDVYRCDGQEVLRDPVDGGFVEYNVEANRKP